MRATATAGSASATQKIMALIQIQKQLDAAAADVLFVGGRLALLLVTKRGLKRSALQEWADKLGQAKQLIAGIIDGS